LQGDITAPGTITAAAGRGQGEKSSPILSASRFPRTRSAWCASLASPGPHRIHGRLEGRDEDHRVGKIGHPFRDRRGARDPGQDLQETPDRGFRGRRLNRRAVVRHLQRGAEIGILPPRLEMRSSTSFRMGPVVLPGTVRISMVATQESGTTLVSPLRRSY